MHFAHLAQAEISAGFATDEFVLRPIVAADTELDYAAVMESKEFLRPWEQTGWPADDFTLEEDRRDVEGLEQRHRDRYAFTYTVMDPSGTECLGCVYLMPPDARSFATSEITPIGEDDWQRVGALVYFWVRTSRLASGLDGRLLASLRDWLARDWNVCRHPFVTNEEVTQQVELLERAGLRSRFRIDKPTQTGSYLAFE